MQTILGLVAAGLGVALVPACMAKLGRPDVRYRHLIQQGQWWERRLSGAPTNASPALVALLEELPAVRR